jgi:hypothetical protein
LNLLRSSQANPDLGSHINISPKANDFGREFQSLSGFPGLLSATRLALAIARHS